MSNNEYDKETHDLISDDSPNSWWKSGVDGNEIKIRLSDSTIIYIDHT